jgi:hypothetical protein
VSEVWGNYGTVPNKNNIVKNISENNNCLDFEDFGVNQQSIHLKREYFEYLDNNEGLTA